MTISLPRSFGLFAAALLGALTVQAGYSTGDDAKPPSPEGEGSAKVPACVTSVNILSVRSADGAYFALATKDGKVKYGRVSDGVVLRIIYHCCPDILALSADGKLLATAGGCDQQKTIKIWRLGDGQMLARLPNGRVEAQFLAFSPDDQFLACHHGNSQIQLWHLRDQELKWSMNLIPGSSAKPQSKPQ